MRRSAALVAALGMIAFLAIVVRDVRAEEPPPPPSGRYAISTSTPFLLPPKGGKLSSSLAQLVEAAAKIPEGASLSSYDFGAVSPSTESHLRAGLLLIDSMERAQVYVHVADLYSAEGVVGGLEALGGVVERISESGDIVQARIPIGSLDAAAGLQEVRAVTTPSYGQVAVGSQLTEGDALLGFDAVRSTFGVSGAGVTIGVISDGILGLNDAMLSGDLPATTLTRDGGGKLISTSGGVIATSFRADGDLEGSLGGSSGAEGTAMLEIVHDIAPGAQLRFANFRTELEFIAAVDFLAANSDVVVDDIGFWTGHYDQTSPVSTNTADELNKPGNPIRGYYTAVHNQANNHYQEEFVPSVCGSDTCHIFAATTDTTDAFSIGPFPTNPVLVPDGGTVIVNLSWDDSFGNTTSDYDLYLFQSDPFIQVTESFGDNINITQKPTESLAWLNQTGVGRFYEFFIVNFQGASAPHILDVFVRGGATLPNGTRINFNTVRSSVLDQSDAGGGVVSVGAIDAADPGIDDAEPFSSRGPTNNGALKPDVAAIDRVAVTGSGGFPNPFPGTSAAAPHVAGLAALLLELVPSLRSGEPGDNPAADRDALRNAILNSAVDLGPGGPDNTFGHGRVNGLGAAAALAPANNPPVAVNDVAATDEDTPLVVAAPGVLGNDTDVEDDALTAALVSDVSNGSLVLNTDGSYTYALDANFNGGDSFTYKANDGAADSNIATVNITVNAVNDDPTVVTAIADVTVDEDSSDTVIPLSGVFADVDIGTNGDSLALSVAQNTNPGLVSASIAAGQLTLDYVADQNGTAQITVRATDADGAFVEDIFDVNVTAINDAPMAADDNATTGEDTSVNIPVLANDSDVDTGDTLTVATTTPPNNGSAVIAVDNSITYTPNAGFTGSDSFTYKANDGLADSNVAMVSITVVADGSIALSITDSTTRLANATADAGQQVTMVVSASGTETMAGLEFDVLYDIAIVGAISAVQGTPISGFSFAANTAVPGVVSMLLAGATAAGLAEVDIALITFNVVGDPGGATTLTFANLLAADASVPPSPIPVTSTGGSITVTPIAADDAYSVDEGATLSVVASLGVLANDIDDGVLTAVKVTDPANGTVALNGDGSFVYAHDGSETTSDSFTYKANDGLLDSNISTVSITINPVNDAPLANDDAATVDEGGTVTVLDSTGTSVLANDTDAEGNPLTAIKISDPANGTLTLNSDGTFSYTHDGGETTSDSFTYMANDGTDDSNVATVAITIIPVVDVVPVAPPSIPPARSFDVLIQADDVTDLAGAQMTLIYDPGLLAFDGAALEFGGCFGEFDDAGGAVSLVFACGAGGQSGAPLALWKATFTSSAVTVSTTTELSITDVVAGDSQIPPQPIPAVGGTVTIAIVPGVCGDLNDDRAINVFDAITLLQIIVGIIEPTETQLRLGDVVRDGTINVFDAILVLQHIVGLTEITDCGPPAP